MMALTSSPVLSRNSPAHLSSGSSFKLADGTFGITSFPVPVHTRKAAQKPLLIQATYRDGGRPSSGSVFVGGFILGGLVVGALGCVYAPQISKVLAGADKKDLMRKLPKFIYDEEKALEKTRKILTEKIEQLNSAIDNVSTQLRTEDAPNGAAVNSEEIEASI